MNVKARARVAVTFALLLVCLAGPAPGGDVIGIYATGDATGSNTAEGTGATTVYIVYSDLSGSGIAGWETNVRVDGGGAMFLGATLLGQGPINLCTPPEFMVGLGVPMTASTAYAVASLSFHMVTTDATYLYTNAIRISSWPDDPGPGYADAADVDNLVRCTPASGGMDYPVFGFNAVPFGPRPEDNTWGGVKGLYER